MPLRGEFVALVSLCGAVVGPFRGRTPPSRSRNPPMKTALLLSLVSLGLIATGCPDPTVVPAADAGSCVAETDAELCTASGKNCDAISATDRCGKARSPNCGACSSPETCGGSGTANLCGTPTCSPETDAE